MANKWWYLEFDNLTETQEKFLLELARFGAHGTGTAHDDETFWVVVSTPGDSVAYIRAFLEHHGVNSNCRVVMEAASRAEGVAMTRQLPLFV